MGLLDSISNAAGSIGSAVSTAIEDSRTAADALVAKVQDAPAALARGASQALEGVKSLGEKALGMAPTGVGLARGAAARRAAAANVQASKFATSRLDDVAAHAAEATDDLARVASAAPRVNAPRAAVAAESALVDAASTVDRAVRLRARTTATTRCVHARDAISATSLVRELDDVARTAASARGFAASAEDLAPVSLTPTA